MSTVALKDLSFTDLIVPDADFSRGTNYRPHFNNFIDANGIFFPNTEAHEELLPQIADLQSVLTKEKITIGHDILLRYEGMRLRVTLNPEFNFGFQYICRRILNPLPRFNDLPGILPRVKQAMLDLGEPGGAGLVLLVGPSGSGKTTVCSSLFREQVMVHGGSAQTIENPVEFELGGRVSPTGHIAQLDLSRFPGGLPQAMQQVLRMGPRFIMPSEARTSVEFAQTIGAANNGHLVFTTGHAPNIPAAITRFIGGSAEQVGESFARESLAEGLAAVIHQTMIVNPKTKGRSYKMEWLFFGPNSQGIRNIIRQGKNDQLQDQIEQQKRRAEADLDLFESPSADRARVGRR